jgi:CelD/BcsL family acetyltransferase involved in cellulose biosynthesis
VSVHGREAWPSIAPVWRELEEASPNSSFFLTEAWASAWLEVYGPQMDPSILVFESGGRAVGACLLVRSRRNRLLPVERVSLNAAGEPAGETTYIEFNDLLCLEGWEEQIAKEIVRHLDGQDWEEFALDGFREGRAYEAFRGALGGLDQQEHWRPCYYVDLEAIRRSGTAYEDALSRTTRWQLRRKTKQYAETGEIRTEAAAELASALGMLEELAELSRQRWPGRGQNAFASPRFMAFHRSLIRKCFAGGGVQMLRVTAGARTVGLIYNLAHRGKVYFYQCGFQYTGDKRTSPGTVTLWQAIQWSLNAGFDDYDFLAGEDRYKQCLATGSRRLVWAVFRKPTVKLRTLDWLRRVNRGLRTRAR